MCRAIALDQNGVAANQGCKNRVPHRAFCQRLRIWVL